MDLLIEGVRFIWTTARWVVSHRERARWWRQMAWRCGLTDLVVRKALGWNWGAEGRSGPLHVRLDSYLPREDALGADIAIRGLPEALLAPVHDRARLFGGGDLDEAALFEVPLLAGPPLLLCAVLDAAARRLLRNLFAGRIDVEGAVRTWEGQVRIQGGELRASYVANARSSAGELAEVLGALLDIARRLLPPEDLARAAATHVRTDPHPGARLHHLRTLQAEAADAAVVREAVTAALTDDAVEVRLAAALASGAEGGPVLRAIVADARAGDAERAKAASGLGTGLSADAARSALAQAICVDAWQTAVACIETLRAHGPGSIDSITAAMVRGRPEVGAAGARALGAIGSAAAEAVLVLTLLRDGDVRLAAAEALGRVGTVDAVLPLREAERVPSADPTLRRVVRASVAAIQSRLHGASPGQLAMAEGDAGLLSLAGDEHGRLTLEDPSGTEGRPE